MSRFENVDMETLLQMLAQNIERLAKLLAQVTKTKDYQNNRETVNAIQAELRKRHRANLGRTEWSCRDDSTNSR